jgi:hypothetical protein
MKKIFVSIIFLISFQAAFACEICGCSSGNYFIGPFPQFHKHFVGIRYSFRKFNTVMESDKTQFSKDFYQTTELWAGWNMGKKWQLLAFLPYNINKQNSDDGIKTNSGLGDATLLLNYNLLNKNNQQLWIGVGAKLPTGTSNADADEIVTTANNQAGTGSYDFLLNAMYSIKLNNWGINTNATYKINGSKDDYRFGNRLSSSAFVFHSIQRGAKTTFSPNAGLLYEHLNANEFNKVKVEDTGGNSLSFAAGLEINFNKVVLGFNAQLPLSENLSNKQTDTKLKGMVHVTLAL